MTKRFETVDAAPLKILAERYGGAATKGEIVILVAPPEERPQADASDLDTLLAAALEAMPVSAAAKKVAKATGLDRGEVYRRALDLKSGDS